MEEERERGDRKGNGPFAYFNRERDDCRFTMDRSRQDWVSERDWGGMGWDGMEPRLIATKTIPGKKKKKLNITVVTVNEGIQ